MLEANLAAQGVPVRAAVSVQNNGGVILDLAEYGFKHDKSPLSVSPLAIMSGEAYN